MRIRHAGMALLLMAVVAGCSSSGKKTPDDAIQPNVYPANYRNQVTRFLMTTLTDPADFRTALIAAPTLKQVGDNQHYIVCIQLNGHAPPREKVAIYLGGSITQFVDAPPGDCAGAAYQPFTELQHASPSK
jgi:hypothetical protein